MGLNTKITYMPMKINMIITKSLRHDDQNSSSAKPRVPNTETITKKKEFMNIYVGKKKIEKEFNSHITTQNIVIHAANGTGLRQ